MCVFVIETARTYWQQKRTTEKDRTRLEEEGTDPCQGGQESILPQKGYASCYSVISMCQKSISQTLCIYRRGLEVIT